MIMIDINSGRYLAALSSRDEETTASPSLGTFAILKLGMLSSDGCHAAAKVRQRCGAEGLTAWLRAPLNDKYLALPAALKEIFKTLDRSINQSINQSTLKEIFKTLDRSINQSINRSINTQGDFKTLD